MGIANGLRMGGAALVGLLLLMGCASRRVSSAAAGAAAARESGSALRWGLLIHGGAGAITRAGLPLEREALYRASLEGALRAGHAVLASGGSALDAVTEVVRILEDDSLFNAGRGAVFTRDGRNELDAAIMDGATRRAGAVGAVRTVRNPILLARAIMERSEHVFLVGEGAEAFAAEQGLEIVPPSYFRTESAWQALERARAAAAGGGRPQAAGRKVADATTEATNPVPDPPDRTGTVGAVALDQQGRLAAATSTGGMTNKLPGRIGDTPVIGAGTYADARCAVSGTGWGEYFLRNSVARDVCARMELGGSTLRAAADTVIHHILPAQAPNTGGLIALSSEGEAVWSFNTSGMFRGRIDQDGSMEVRIFADE